MALVAEAVFRAFTPRKLNYELLGNAVAQLHWHLFPLTPTIPTSMARCGRTWASSARSGPTAPSDEPRLASLKQRLLAAMEGTDLRIEHRFP